MAIFKAHKVVGNLPDPLEPDTIYLVRVGEGFDFYATDDTGNIAHKINGPGGGTELPALTENALDGAPGSVAAFHTLGGIFGLGTENAPWLPDLGNPRNATGFYRVDIFSEPKKTLGNLSQLPAIPLHDGRGAMLIVNYVDDPIPAGDVYHYAWQLYFPRNTNWLFYRQTAWKISDGTPWFAQWKNISHPDWVDILNKPVIPTNFKTVNGEAITGTGNIVVGGGELPAVTENALDGTPGSIAAFHSPGGIFGIGTAETPWLPDIRLGKNPNGIYRAAVGNQTAGDMPADAPVEAGGSPYGIVQILNGGMDDDPLASKQIIQIWHDYITKNVFKRFGYHVPALGANGVFEPWVRIDGVDWDAVRNKPSFVTAQTITQAAYDALDPKDPNTLYVISG